MFQTSNMPQVCLLFDYVIFCMAGTFKHRCREKTPTWAKGPSSFTMFYLNILCSSCTVPQKFCGRPLTKVANNWISTMWPYDLNFHCRMVSWKVNHNPFIHLSIWLLNAWSLSMTLSVSLQVSEPYNIYCFVHAEIYRMYISILVYV